MRLCIFDVGGVMVDGFDVAPDIAARLGLPVSELRPLLRASDFELLHTGRISSAEFWDRFRARTGLPVDDEYWGAFFRPLRRPRMYDLVRRLREAGVRVVAGTNTLDAHYRIHAELGDYQAFAHTYASHLIHVAKPDPAFFRHILAAEKVTPDQALFVDDVEANVRAAAGLGMPTVLFQTEADAIARVEAWVGAGVR
ncbi:MAG: HAD family phosphatase [Trueperaceae bacterium]|nr:HAD family phosphatase [Trueperaceae bacterium]